MVNDSILILRGVKKRFGGFTVVDGVDMDIVKGRLTMLIGPNGSGKTTLINIISGFYKPDEGQISFDGKDITNMHPNRIAQLGLVRTFQIPSPFIKLSVLENMLVASSNPGEAFFKAPIRRFWIKKERDDVERAFKILDLLEMSHLYDKPSYTLSGGQLKLLEIGRALMFGAKMILMDEPASGVNPTLAHKIFSHMVNIKDALDITFLIVEHRLEIALKHVDDVYAMIQGRIVSHGSGDEVLRDPKVIEGYLGG
ncbi:MAG: ABC transporter ATP-binding protein [Nitrososphaerota archaeon]|nr:ABC transporter ATP-binding protein [Nitrososphaerales archaeon]MDW8045243.1 ABC transporter ATP-binding protein [Nitrososphaerota archaeon]